MGRAVFQAPADGGERSKIQAENPSVSRLPREGGVGQGRSGP